MARRDTQARRARLRRAGPLREDHTRQQVPARLPHDGRRSRSAAHADVGGDRLMTYDDELMIDVDDARLAVISFNVPADVAADIVKMWGALRNVERTKTANVGSYSYDYS